LAVLAACGSNSSGSSKEEGIALDYINVFFNGTDLDAKQKFVEENVHPEAQGIFNLATKTVTSDEKKIQNPKVVDSVKYENDGKKATLVLLEGDKAGGKAEYIVMVMDGKVTWGFTQDESNESLQGQFTKMRELFK